MHTSYEHHIFQRTFPVCLALIPIGFLFGILAGQQGLNLISVLLLSIFGFTGSGQFIFLGFYQDHFLKIGYFTAFLIILSMNIRYIPMTLTTIPAKAYPKSLMLYSHLLSDESFAVEKITDDYATHFKIRIYVFLTWVLSTIAGQMLSAFIPKEIIGLLNISFPIAATLFTLSLLNIQSKYINRKSIKLLILFLLNLLLFMIIGANLFWLPAIIVNYFFLKSFK
ncbi:AzlC family ABC transporter permease [Acinetobacter shaoyimingii]|uniref:AzlC family ABC transporter permease n=1 Tax=Acinetobacter shaoyimingii TaxID=2715164 RepID=A0A6G8RWK2_9GAMM|nr:AzlC family ABC transporter permease [Acinetobacter shaoyimingii]QIO06103.1 AzlC family ABC transporter permease [Acinetobacter shaoyimingii]